MPGEADSWSAQTKPFVHQNPGERSSDPPEETDPDLLVSAQQSPVETWLVVACCRVRDTEQNSVCMGHFEGGHHFLHYLHHNLVSGQTTGKEHSPAHQQKIGLKIY